MAFEIKEHEYYTRSMYIIIKKSSSKYIIYIFIPK